MLSYIEKRWKTVHGKNRRRIQKMCTRNITRIAIVFGIRRHFTEITKDLLKQTAG